MSNAFLNIAVRAAREAGDWINQASLNLHRLTVQQKSPRDFVSEVDRRAESIIVETLRQSFPEHGFLGEEFGATNPHAPFQWVIDPLDGTTNFLHGLPQYAVSIALKQHNKVIAAVVYDCFRDELFTATRGGGAFMNQKRIRVSSNGNLDAALFATGFPFRSQERSAAYLAMMAEVMSKVAGLRRMGSAALDLAWTAMGRFDGFWEMGLSPWDFAAGALLVEEAGGLIGDFHGEPHYWESGDIVCGNVKFFAVLKEMTAAHFPKSA